MSIDEEKVVDLIAGTHRVICDKLIPFMDRPKAFKVGQKAILEAVKKIGRIPEIFELVEDFKYDTELDFIRAIAASYVGISIIDEYEWKTTEFFYKMAIASFISDILMFEDDFQKLKEWERGDLDSELLGSEIKGQGERVLKLMDKYKLANGKPFFSSDVIAVVAQHNERPDGTGIPNGVKHTGIALFTSIFLVSRYFVFLLTEASFDLELKREIITKLQERFPMGHGKQVVNILVNQLR